MIITDVALNQGNSGGPLFLLEDCEPTVAVGMNTAAAAGYRDDRLREVAEFLQVDLRADYEGLNYSLSSTEIRAFLREEGFSIDDSGTVQKRTPEGMALSAYDFDKQDRTVYTQLGAPGSVR